ncbi:MAG TPA: TraR/DksA C4-type zinc finger protein [bacterium]|nr:TraR/DksA C4-type zinc finger protein [bacterium]HNS48451.1 TraR/DksA C4-type zinc finger protein [bacterium]
MEKKTLERFRKALEKERDRLLKSLEGLEKAGSLNTERDTEKSGITTHPADQGTDNFERELQLGLVTEENTSLQEVEEALARIESKTYGRCESCGCAIESKRLMVLPHARYCLGCRTKMES